MPRPIKRYENRKLYDTVAKKYISLEEIARLVRAGEEVTVTDNATGADLTAETLTKVILEEQASRRRPLPPQFLHDLLRGSGKFVNRNLDLLIEASLRRLGPVRETLEELARLRERLDKLEKLIESFEREEQHGDDTKQHTQ
ncbi:MAG TPA: polyhydroxyalkanoate synthesis regulator DNA-binding domain-containing protein [Bryobacteraceae bacterium]|nr:polyhydroxyalkanoate synthesis regulator DNA-binding domain-containing protein [Bryobacteraceae bacterium]HOL71807.1 polyhydroxyalkanoate synthesis regulator DNA-binding domain-containing protein [Bryobacteraceae bacterium]HOQ46336.1 polyhydroxyalkanoate synthesis regulator DNA-binding domain-containing protein [Bryobacteraceae bacterium]HPQ13827.1 polyhydroxyalkanoate synthesis regulator DNA-binding domain-containing protein [Bryobacteraceae bacterium]HPU72227.1 polyhydroxyalkanoate synthes